MEKAILIAQAIQTALILVGGFVLYYLVSQERKVFEARIKQLEGLAAPALATQLEVVSKLANESQQKITDLQKQLEPGRQAHEKASDERTKNELAGYLEGVSECMNSLLQDVKTMMKEQKPGTPIQTQRFLNFFQDTTDRMMERTLRKWQAAQPADAGT